MVTENWKVTPDADCQGLVEELLETIMSSVASDSEKGITRRDYTKSVAKYPMLLEFLGEVVPSRPAATTFLSTMMPKGRAYYYCPEYRTEKEKDLKPFLPFGASASREVVFRLGGVNNQVARTSSTPLPQLAVDLF